jgi:flagellar basal-body rod protein FlgB
MRIFGPVIEGLGAAIGLYQTRHRVLAENVANVETPGYRARDVDFGTALAEAFAAGAPPAESIVERRAAAKIDGNSVDLDTEMARLSENALTIVALSQILSRRYAGLKAAIDGGSR